ncbi:MAG: metal-dependent transcriptional regulator [Cellulophaga sp.]
MTFSEENYLKVIYHLGDEAADSVATNAIAEAMKTKASSATDMVKKLADKGFLFYKKYQGTSLTEEGKEIAVKIIRKHRLWECFLVEKLNFSWDEVHDIAEQLEHIKSEKLIEELDAFLGFPKKDPHGDPIPDKHGNIHTIKKTLLGSCSEGDKGVLVGVEDSSSKFLRYLDKLELSLGKAIEVISIEPFDNSMQIEVGTNKISISAQIANNIYIQKT